MGLQGVEIVALGYHTPTENIHHREPCTCGCPPPRDDAGQRLPERHLGATAAKAGKEDAFGLIVGSAIIAPSFPSAPRTVPSEPNSGTRLLPRVSDGEAHTWPRMQDSRRGEELVGQFRHARP
jgi:hypothetical protein